MEILANDLDHPIDPDLVFLGETSRHFLPQSDCEQSKRDQHHNAKGQEHASAQTHQSLLINNPPSHSLVTPERPRRTTTCSRVSTRATIVSGSTHPTLSRMTRFSRHG